MTTQAIAYLNYASAPSGIPNKEQIENTKAAIRHLSGIGRLLQCIDIEAPPANRLNHLKNLTDGVIAIGELIVIVSDAAMSSICEIAPLDVTELESE